MIKKTLPMIALLGLMGIGHGASAIGHHCQCWYNDESGSKQLLCAGIKDSAQACTQFCHAKYGNNLVEAKDIDTCIRYKSGTGCKCGD